ncbi:hypothetical protein H5119_19820 [Pseudoalteromonas sp. SG45-5]|uniref:hypothetical protein n=1 Tax=unclassified Pseudoalteromonas TaxID=194690 RepID=UPI0015FDFE1F|nr:MULTISPECIES: hypothetical protein [unclassified Pseudoalteromonas]MBB1387730.1 hypothetical protein [Pseudoalteromonas sp. SG45-5]MBB1395954.1 hypothetical protein [Pseudoalteromonas sp. SG44-4]MBB1449383.1 hypothetical protein [Pseudoalteromonas sp. SG41-6]
MSNQNFSTREWVFVLIIASIVQGSIWYVSFVNSTSGSALTYVSFAGTLISIILAVLAIGYTYGESISQKNKTDTVSNQISVLNEVIKSIKIESQSLEHISTISDELTRFASTFEEKMSTNETTVSQVSSSLETLLNDYDRYDTTRQQKAVEANFNKSDAANLFMSFRSPLMEITLLFILASRDKTYIHSAQMVEENVIKYIDRARENSSDEISGPPDANKLFTGSFLSMQSILKGFNLISGDEERRITVSMELMKVVKETTIDNPKSSGLFYKQIRNEVLKDIDINV